MKFKMERTLIAALFLSLTLFVLPAYGVTNELVGSSESHSIEKFDSNGNWIKTFASTGPWIPFGIAASPVTEDVFVVTNTATNILRYKKSGASFGPKGSYWSTFALPSAANANPAQSLLFDSSGNLYVSTAYGSDPGYQVEIFKYSPKELLKMSPSPTGSPIITTAGRGDQMAWDAFGNICVASFIVPNTVQCYNPGTGALAFDYASEIQAQGIQPDGLAFGPNNNLTVNSLFTGEIWVETTERVGPMTLLASGMVHDLGWLAVDSDGKLYTPSYHDPEDRYNGPDPNDCTFYACMDTDFGSDLIYKIDPTSGAVTNFITNHIWGPYQMIFVPF
jgi:DNA-binding beta-propeller fold protein YncE